MQEGVRKTMEMLVIDGPSRMGVSRGTAVVDSRLD
jgi:hypothetical protein